MLSDIAERGFCNVCGSSMSMQYRFASDRIGVCTGTVTEADPPLPRLEAHIFLEEKAPWFVIPDDGAKRYDGFSPGYDDKIKRWREELGSQ